MEPYKQAQKKKFQTYRYHAIRIILFISACLCAVFGILILTTTSNQQGRIEAVSSEVTRVEQQADVLLLMSYNDSDVITPLERSGVASPLVSSGVGVDIEYMDAINCPAGSAAYQDWSAALAAKLAKHGSYSAVICAGDEALTYAEQNHAALFSNTPVIFFGVNDLAHAQSANNSGYACGIFEQADFLKTMKLTCDLLPSAKNFLVVCDDTPSGVGDRQQFDSAMGSISGMGVQYLDASTMTRDELAQRLQAAGSDSIVFFLDAYNDSTGATYSLDESARFVSNATAQPVFSAASGAVGQGVCASGFTDPEKAGQKAAEMCVKVLNGTSPGTIALVNEGTGGFVFDAAVMGKHGISASSLPSEAVVINQSVFNWDSVKSLAMPVGLILLGVLLILAFAFMGYRHSIRDMHEIIESRNDIQHRYYHDQLTDKPNMQWLNEFGANEKKSSHIKSIIEIDFVDFNDVNDSFGHAVGDAVIREVSERLEAMEKEFLVRPVGAEFLLGFKQEIDKGSKELHLLDAILRKPVVIGDDEIDVDARMGIANFEPGMKFEDMITGVDLAVRQAKLAGREYEAVFYDHKMKENMEEKIEITSCLKSAIAEESFVVLYQPQVDTMTSEVNGYEALVRLKDDLYYPGQFIPVAEMSGLVIEVDRIVTKKVVQQLSTWKKRHKRLRPVSINYSAIQLRDEGYIDFLLDLLREYDIPANLIKIEITESLLMGSEDQADELFNRLAKEGIPMALDDFGTGYTSLSRVSTIPAEYVKIDKSLVDTYMVRGKEGFVDNLTQLIHGLKKKIIVEGVETADQLELCRELGCETIQGYYFSKPLLPEKAAQFEAGATPAA